MPTWGEAIGGSRATQTSCQCPMPAIVASTAPVRTDHSICQARFQRAGLRLVMTEIDVANTLLDVAAMARDFTFLQRARTVVRDGHLAIARLTAHLDLPQKEIVEVERALMQLDERLDLHEGL
jgi:hypothetical protein